MSIQESELFEDPARFRVIAIATFIVFVDFLGWGLIGPIIPNLLADISDADVGTLAIYGGWLMTVYAIGQFLCAPLLSTLSDQFGRRPILCIAMIGLTLDHLLMTIAPTVLLLILARVLSGVFGSATVSAHSAAADLTAPSERAQAFGIIGSAGGLGLVLGPAFGGFLGSIDVRLPFLAAASLCGVGAALCLVWFPETLSPDRRRRVSWRAANPFSVLFRHFTNKALCKVLCAYLAFQVALQSVFAVWSFFVVERFGWSPNLIGVSMMVYGLIATLTQLFLIGPANRMIGERNTACLGCGLGLVAFFGFAFDPDQLRVFIWIIVGALAMIAVPAIQAQLSTSTSDRRQGELQGAMASIVWVAAIGGPIVFTLIFNTFTNHQAIYFPGAAFVAASVLFCVCAALITRANGN